MCQTNNQILADFCGLCMNLSMGASSEEDVQRITKAMVDSGQEEVMKIELQKIIEVSTRRR
jgi:hypothetical protein